jgi:hypothetical protein
MPHTSVMAPMYRSSARDMVRRSLPASLQGDPTVNRRLSVAVLTALAVLGVSPAATAAPARTVDPSTLTPPLNPNFTWTCFDTGKGPICQGTYEDAYENEDFGMDCDGQPIDLSGSGVERMTRWHLPDGRATKTEVNLRYRETLRLSTSGGGPVVNVRGSWNRHYDYLVPGDRSMRVLTETGAEWLATAPGHGVVFRDTGLIRWLPGAEYDEVDVIHGHRDMYSDPAGVQEAVCAVLTG